MEIYFIFEESDFFLLAGYRSKLVKLLPYSRHTVEIVFVPIDTGNLILPKPIVKPLFDNDHITWTFNYDQENAIAIKRE